jgi:hypothetical protein
MLWTICVSFAIGVVAAFLFFRKNPLWLFPWRKLKSHKEDAKAYLRERLNKL